MPGFYRRFCLILLLLSCFTMALPSPVQAKTYVITDGTRMLTYGVPSASEGASQESPSETLTVYRYGEAISVSAREETVAQLLDRLGIDLSEQDILSHKPDTPVTAGMQLRIDRILTRQETYTTTIPHEVTTCSYSRLPRGETEVLIPGRDGELLCTAQVTYRNGQEISRTLLEQKQTIAPITEVIGQGTGEVTTETPPSSMPVIGNGYIIMPTGEVLTYYKTDNVTATGYTHTDAGCDKITSTGTTVHYGTAAVDPRFIPYGTRMLIVSHDGQRYYGIATAEDCGGAIKRDKMDLYFPTHQECIEFGRRRCTIYFLG